MCSLVLLLYVLLVIINECNSLRVSISSSSIGKRSSIRLSSSRGDEYEKMKIDKSKLDDKEKERIAYIEKLSLEADEMVSLFYYYYHDYNCNYHYLQIRLKLLDLD